VTRGLAAEIVLHTALGLALTAVVWLVGAGCLVLLRRPREPRSFLDAYPFGLLLTMAVAVPPLLWRPLGVVSIAALGFLAVRGVGARVLPATRGALGYGLLGAAGFGAGLGALLHGPTDELDSAAYGGMLWYVAKVVSAAESIVPFRDLLAEGEHMIYAEAGTSFVGAAVSWLPGFDPILYHAATLPTFAAASLCVGLALFLADRPPLPPLAAVAAALLAVATLPYATWVTETPPAAFAIPLAFSLWRVWRDELDSRWLITLSAVVALDYFQTKVIAIMALGLLLLAGLVERNRNRPDFARLVAIGAALLALGAAVVVGMLFAFAGWYAGLAKPKSLPLDAIRGVTDGDVDVHSVALVLFVAGEVVLALALARARSWALLVVFAATVLPSWFLAGYGFDIALGSEILLAAGLVVSGGRIEPRLAVAAGALLAVSVALREVLGTKPGSVLALMLLIAVGAVVLARTSASYTRALTAGVAAAVLAFAALNRFDLADPPAAVTTADRDIWEQVHDRAPDDGLVFTTLTGLDVTPHRGWNNYPAVADRQLFIAGWYDGRLVSHPEDRDRKLAENRAVLDGRTSPESLQLSRAYGRYFAVAERDAHFPVSLRRVYENDEYALYEIP
jgi:hypothetical protein